MPLRTRHAGLLVSLLFAGCQVERAGDTPARAADTTAAAAPAPPADPAPAGPCVLTATDTLTLFARPSPAATVFGVLAAGDSVRVAGKTDGAWLGFDPAVAQAANVGPFRLRWVAPDGSFVLSGGCDDLPSVPALAPDACYLMAGLPIAVRDAPRADAAVVDSVQQEGYAVATERSPDGWARVRLDEGRAGWVAPADGSFNGPCGAVSSGQ